jgi:hypothetical protein
MLTDTRSVREGMTSLMVFGVTEHESATPLYIGQIWREILGSVSAFVRDRSTFHPIYREP